MKISKTTDSYNERRYGRPWIATVDFTADIKGAFTFGEWCGQNGCEGVLEIDAEPGDTVATGQKDSRKPRNSAPEYHIVQPDGQLIACSKPEALAAFRAKHDQPSFNPLACYTTEQLQAELARRGVQP